MPRTAAAPFVLIQAVRRAPRPVVIQIALDHCAAAAQVRGWAAEKGARAIGRARPSRAYPTGGSSRAGA